MDRKHNGKNIIGKSGWVATCLIWLAIWQVASILVASPLLLPSPWQTLQALLDLATTKDFYLNMAWTVTRCILAMILSFATGVLCAWIAYKWKIFRSFLKLPVSFFKAVPVMAIIIYVILLLDSNWVGVLVCFLMCFPVVYTNVLSGLDAMSSEYLDLAKICKLSELQKIRLIYRPGLLAPIQASVSLIAGLSWKAVVAAEVLSVPAHSLGYPMINAKYYLETPELFAYIAVIVSLSVIFERLIRKAMNGIEWRAYEGSKLFGGVRSNKDDMEKGHIEPDYKAPEIVFNHVTKSFDGQKVLDEFGLNIDGGKVTALVGPSGLGKTTLARLVTGLELPDDGSVFITENCRIAYLFQEDRLLPWLNVYDNMALGCLSGSARIGGGKSNVPGDVKEARAVDRIGELARALEIEEVLWKLPEELSGGMRHRVALGRTFAPASELLIFDEPFRGLDTALKQRIIDRLWEKETRGRTVLLITHSDEDSRQLADRKVRL